MERLCSHRPGSSDEAGGDLSEHGAAAVRARPDQARVEGKRACRHGYSAEAYRFASGGGLRHAALSSCRKRRNTWTAASRRTANRRKRSGAIAEKAKLLYLANRFAELSDHAEAAIGLYPEDSTLRTLLGHAYWNLGAWERASQAYDKARELDPENGIVILNAARARERAGDREGAFVRYPRGPLVPFLRTEAYDDLSQTIPRLKELDPTHPAVCALAEKRAYALEDWESAEKELRAAIGGIVGSTDDSAVYYLLALLSIRSGKREEALPLLERAVSLESEYAPYLFRLAETRFLIADDPDAPGLEEDLRKAQELAPEDGWIANLAGQVAIARGDLSAAERLTEKALAALRTNLR